MHLPEVGGSDPDNDITRVVVKSVEWLNIHEMLTIRPKPNYKYAKYSSDDLSQSIIFIALRYTSSLY